MMWTNDQRMVWKRAWLLLLDCDDRESLEDTDKHCSKTYVKIGIAWDGQNVHSQAQGQ